MSNNGNNKGKKNDKRPAPTATDRAPMQSLKAKKVKKTSRGK